MDSLEVETAQKLAQNRSFSDFLNKNISKILLIIFLTIFLFLGAGKAFDHKLNHSSPIGMLASDAYTHDWVAQNLYDTGYYNQPPDYSFESVLDYKKGVSNYKLFHPPIMPFITASIAKLSGFRVYDADTIFIFLSIALMILLIYFIIANFNENLALFSLPLCLLFLQRKFFISMAWGWWNFLIAEFFLISLILLILSPRFKYRSVIIAVIITAAFMSHGVEIGYAAIFISFYLGSILIFDRPEFWPLVREQIQSSLIFILLGGYYLIILFKTMGAMGYSQIRLMSNSAFMQQVYNGTPPNYFIFFEEFLGFRIVLISGMLVSVYLIIKNKHKIISFLSLITFMSISPYIYILAGERGFQWRFLWPIYLAIAFGTLGLLIYSFLGKRFGKDENYQRPLCFKLIIFVGSLSLLVWLVYPMPFIGEGVVGEKEYSAYQWIHQNVNPYDNLLIMYSPQNSQITSLYMLKRELYVSRPETLQNMNLYSSKLSLLINPSLRTDYFCKKEDCSLFNPSNFLEYRSSGGKYYENRSICSFDYLFLSLKSYEEFNQANLAYLQSLINKQVIQVVFNNQAIIISKNILPEEECEAHFKS